MENDLEITHEWKGDTTTLAVKRASAAGNCGFVWLGGFRSDMSGSKATTMVEEAARLGCSSLRFDYSGHGISEGQFEQGTISRWVSESLKVVRDCTAGPQVLVGSSMGGWIALRVAQEFARSGESDRLAGLLLIAPAPDFTSDLMEPEFSDEQRTLLDRQGFITEESAYSNEPNVITKDLIEDGRNNRVLQGALHIGKPIRILQGMKDPDVPYHHAMRLVDRLAQDDVVITLVKDGDHRLSTDDNLDLLRQAMRAMVS